MGWKIMSAEEAAAAAIAIAQLEAEAGGLLRETSATVSPWQRAALIEGVGAKETVQDSEGGARWLS